MTSIRASSDGPSDTHEFAHKNRAGLAYEFGSFPQRRSQHAPRRIREHRRDLLIRYLTNPHAMRVR